MQLSTKMQTSWNAPRSCSIRKRFEWEFSINVWLRDNISKKKTGAPTQRTIPWSWLPWCCIWGSTWTEKVLWIWIFQSKLSSWWRGWRIFSYAGKKLGSDLFGMWKCSAVVRYWWCIGTYAWHVVCHIYWDIGLGFLGYGRSFSYSEVIIFKANIMSARARKISRMTTRRLSRRQKRVTRPRNDGKIYHASTDTQTTISMTQNYPTRKDNFYDLIWKKEIKWKSFWPFFLESFQAF